MQTEDEVLGEFDYVVIGAGSAGCVLTNRLSADVRNTVLLLEAGGQDNHIWIHIPVGYLYTMGNPRTDWCFKAEPEAHLGNRRINYPRGRVLGGSSSLNGMIYMRGQSANYDSWRQTGVENTLADWSFGYGRAQFLTGELHSSMPGGTASPALATDRDSTRR
jgi:choline dehydrogenase